MPQIWPLKFLWKLQNKRQSYETYWRCRVELQLAFQYKIGYFVSSFVMARALRIKKSWKSFSNFYLSNAFFTMKMKKYRKTKRIRAKALDESFRKRYKASLYDIGKAVLGGAQGRHVTDTFSCIFQLYRPETSIYEHDRHTKVYIICKLLI